jgi:hypothetical protein
LAHGSELDPLQKTNKTCRNFRSAKPLDSDSSLSSVSLLGIRAGFKALRAHQRLGKLSNLRKSLAFDSISVKSLGELWNRHLVT